MLGSMRILACHAAMHPDTRAALAAFASHTEIEWVGDSDYYYWIQIKKRWTGSEDLVIIEQDIVITSDTLSEFESCAEPWCVFDYWLAMGKINTGIGCVRFTAELQREWPFDTIFPNPVKWDVIDAGIANCLMPAGYSPHVHGTVDTSHEYDVYLLPHGRATWRNTGAPANGPGRPGFTPTAVPPGSPRLRVRNGVVIERSVYLQKYGPALLTT